VLRSGERCRRRTFGWRRQAALAMTAPAGEPIPQGQEVGIGRAVGCHVVDAAPCLLRGDPGREQIGQHAQGYRQSLAWTKRREPRQARRAGSRAKRRGPRDKVRLLRSVPQQLSGGAQVAEQTPHRLHDADGIGPFALTFESLAYQRFGWESRGSGAVHQSLHRRTRPRGKACREAPVLAGKRTGKQETGEGQDGGTLAGAQLTTVITEVGVPKSSSASGVPGSACQLEPSTT